MRTSAEKIGKEMKTGSAGSPLGGIPFERYSSRFSGVIQSLA
jgi:hypothetical protein